MTEELNKDMNLIWIDVETTGLDAGRDRILELACVITTPDAKNILMSDSFIIHTPRKILNRMDDYCKNLHSASGLDKLCENSTMTLQHVDKYLTEEVFPKYVTYRKSPLCGNNVGFDRGFLKADALRIHSYLYYRNIDVSTFAESFKRLRPDVVKPEKTYAHRALNEILESIAEYRFYCDAVLEKK